MKLLLGNPYNFTNIKHIPNWRSIYMTFSCGFMEETEVCSVSAIQNVQCLRVTLMFSFTLHVFYMYIAVTYMVTQTDSSRKVSGTFRS